VFLILFNEFVPLEKKHTVYVLVAFARRRMKCLFIIFRLLYWSGVLTSFISFLSHHIDVIITFY
jgi:hypothetical protein